jgi:hypothetical protein
VEALRAGAIWGVGCFGKAAAEPPHSIVGWARRPSRTHISWRCGRRASRLAMINLGAVLAGTDACGVARFLDRGGLVD